MKHIVQAGECLSSIAQDYGFGNFRTIYDHPDNAEFKRLRPNPNVINPGDEIVIPDKELRNHDAPTDKRHKYKRKAPTTMLRLVIADDEGQPYSGNKYRLKVADKTYDGTLGSDGLIEKKIPVDAKEGELMVWGTEGPPKLVCTWILNIGSLDPADTTTGIQGRLKNLGFNCGPLDGICGPKTEAAIRAFQLKHKLAVDGIAGPKTQAQLIKAHGC